MHNHEGFDTTAAAIGGEPLAGSGFEDERPNQEPLDETGPDTEEPVR